MHALARLGREPREAAAAVAAARPRVDAPADASTLCAAGDDAAHAKARACLDPKAVAAALDDAADALAGVDAAIVELWVLDLAERVAAWAAGPAGALGFLQVCLDLDGLPG